jgi:hypothetical protein
MRPEARGRRQEARSPLDVTDGIGLPYQPRPHAVGGHLPRSGGVALLHGAFFSAAIAFCFLPLRGSVAKPSVEVACP